MNRICAVAVLCCLPGGCAGRRSFETQLHSPADLLATYNARAEKVQRLWARVDVTIWQTGEDGRRQREQGDGIVAYQKPDELALALGKLGDTWYWLGSNAQRFWWFDLNPQDDRPNTAYVGRHEDLDSTNARSGVLLPPRQLIELLGITTLPAAAEQVAVEPVRGREQTAVTFRVPVTFGGRPAFQQIRVGTITSHPMSIEFIDTDGQLLASAQLGGYKPLPTPGAPLGAWPAVPTRITALLPEHGVELKIVVDSPSLTSEEEKFSDAMFDFDAIRADKKPQEVKTFSPQ